MSENMALGLSALLTFFVMIFIASVGHRRRVSRFLQNALPVGHDVWKRAERFLDSPDMGMPGIALFEVLYNAFKRDEKTATAIAKLSTSQKFESAHEAIEWIKKRVPSIARRGAQRFIFEELIFERGQSAMPRSVDVDPIDVSVNPVSVNPVSVNPVSVNPVSVNPAGESGHHDLDFADYVPVVTLVYSAMRNGRKVFKGQKNAKLATGHVLLDTAGRGLASFGGAKVGFILGTTLAPFTGGTSALFIPAATTVLGSILGNFGGKGIVKYIKDRPVRRAAAVLMNTAGEFFTQFESRVPELLIIARGPYDERRKHALKRLKKSQSFVLRVAFPSIETAFFKFAARRLEQESLGIEKFYGALLSKGKGLRRKRGGLLVFSQGQGILLGEPTLIEGYKEVEKALDKVESERRRVA